MIPILTAAGSSRVVTPTTSVGSSPKPSPPVTDEPVSDARLAPCHHDRCTGVVASPRER